MKLFFFISIIVFFLPLFSLADKPPNIIDENYLKKCTSYERYNAKKIQHAEQWIEKKAAKILQDHSAFSFTFVIGKCTIVHRSFGYQDSSKAKLFSTSNSIPLGSISKIFAGLSISKLINDGIIEAPDSKVIKYLSNIELKNKISDSLKFSHLLTHRAGYPSITHFGKSIAHSPSAGENFNFAIDVIPSAVFMPGEKYLYSNHSPAIISLIVEDITGKDYAQFLNDEFFFKMSMVNTKLEYHPEHSPNLVLGYDLKSGITQSLEYVNPYFSPSFMVISSAEDMRKFIIENLKKSKDHNSLGKKIFNLSFTPLSDQQNPTRAMFYQVQEVNLFKRDFDSKNMTTLVNHGGIMGNNHTILMLSPELGFGLFISIMGSNGGVGPKRGAPRKLARNFLHKMKIVKKEISSPTEVIIPLTELAQAEGIYRTAKEYEFIYSSPIESIINFLGDTQDHDYDKLEIVNEEVHIKTNFNMFTRNYDFLYKCSLNSSTLSCSDDDGYRKISLEKSFNNYFLGSKVKMNKYDYIKYFLYNKFIYTWSFIFLLAGGLIAFFCRKKIPKLSLTFLYIHSLLSLFIISCYLLGFFDINKVIKDVSVMNVWRITLFQTCLVMFSLSFIFIASNYFVQKIKHGGSYHLCYFIHTSFFSIIIIIQSLYFNFIE